MSGLLVVVARLGLCLLYASVVLSQHLFVYDWPDLKDNYANFTDRKDGHGVEIPHWRLHYGTGRVMQGASNEHKTSQFALYKIFYERAMLDPRRTLEMSSATTFFVSFDLGMHTAFLESNGRMRRSNCPSAELVIQRLNESTAFRARYGHDHLVVFSLNQNMNYFMAAPKCQDFLRFCWNCTKLAIDEYLFTAKHRAFEMKNRGANWHAVPFPSDYHYSAKPLAEDDPSSTSTSLFTVVPTNFQQQSDSTEVFLPPWERQMDRPTIVSFTGSPRRYNDIATAMREMLIKQCAGHGTSCVYGRYNHDDKAGNSQNKLARESVFCLQPPGDMPTRKSVFDAILSGCIPVLFHPLTARYMYEWHWGQRLWEEIPINFDSHADSQALVSGRVDFVAKLIDLYRNEPEVVKKKQARLREVAHQLQYALITDELAEDGRTFRKKAQVRPGKPDAYEIAMSQVLAIHAGKATHARTSHYVVCEQLTGRGQELQTADNCNSTNSLLDPSAPSSTTSLTF